MFFLNTVLPTHSTKTETTEKSPRKITKSIVMDPVEADLKNLLRQGIQRMITSVFKTQFCLENRR